MGRAHHKKNISTSKTNPCGLREIAKGLNITDNLKSGLQALGRNSRRIKAQDPGSILYSIDFDTALKKSYPEDSRWDYAVECDELYYIEIHPANGTSNIDDLRKKVDWLRETIKSLKLEISKPQKYIWIPTGAVKISRNSKYQKQLSQHGIERQSAPFKI